MPNEQTLQVTLPIEEAERIRAIAKSVGATVSAYVRGLILSKTAPAVPAWSAPMLEDRGPLVQRNNGAARMSTQLHDFLLERTTDHANGTAEYRVFLPNLTPLTFTYFQGSHAARDLENGGRLMLAGSHVLWKLTRSIADEKLRGQLLWLLEREPGK